MKLVATLGLLTGSVLSMGAGARYTLKKPDFSYWNDTNDDILTEFKQLMSIAEHRSKVQGEYGATLRTLQRFAELVDMIMYLQRVPFFGQYWYYGCWCAPEGFLKTVGSGYGKPVDAIDRSCRDMSECYECAQMDYGQDCTTAEVNYRWHGEVDDEGNKIVKCDDPEDTCAWAICQCDSRLATQLHSHERVWNLHHHQKWGDFNRDDACFPVRDRFAVGENGLNFADGKAAAPALPGSAGSSSSSASSSDSAAAGSDSAAEGSDEWTGSWMRSLSGGAVEGELDSFANMPSLKLKLAGEFGNKQVKACCGKYPQRYPYRLGHNHACCSNETPYNVLYSECCADGTVAKSGSCL
jgi:hypothetical protein